MIRANPATFDYISLSGGSREVFVALSSWGKNCLYAASLRTKILDLVRSNGGVMNMAHLGRLIKIYRDEICVPNTARLNRIIECMNELKIMDSGDVALC